MDHYISILWFLINLFRKGPPGWDFSHSRPLEFWHRGIGSVHRDNMKYGALISSTKDSLKHKGLVLKAWSLESGFITWQSCGQSPRNEKEEAYIAIYERKRLLGLADTSQLSFVYRRREICNRASVVSTVLKMCEQRTRAAKLIIE